MHGRLSLPRYSQTFTPLTFALLVITFILFGTSPVSISILSLSSSPPLSPRRRHRGHCIIMANRIRLRHNNFNNPHLNFIQQQQQPSIKSTSNASAPAPSYTRLHSTVSSNRVLAFYNSNERRNKFKLSFSNNYYSDCNHNYNHNSAHRLFSALSSPNDSHLSSSSSETPEESSYYTPPDPQRLAQLMPDVNPLTGQKYTTYEKCVRRLYLTNLFHPVKLGLQNMERLHDALGNPMDQKDKDAVTVIHIAGTNGKGSTALKIAKVLELAGYNVGLFVSPHIASFRERMQMNSVPISEGEVEELLPNIYAICEEEEIPATFFEITTALAFSFFQRRGANVVVLETGLGGRLDATNVVASPALCVITSIGLEHTRILGDTVELIAKEKAGIMKSGVPVLVGPDVPHEVMRQCAVEKQVEGYYSCGDVLGDDMDKNPEKVALRGVEYVDYDMQNAMIAKAALRLLEQKNGGDSTTTISFPLAPGTVESGIQHRPPCRFEERVVHSDNSENKAVTVILDVAHNPPAMEHLVLKLEATYPEKEKRVVVGFSADKDLGLCGRSLLSIVKDPSRLHLVEAAHPRAAKLEDILTAEPKLRESNFDEEDRSITAQVKSALAIAQKNDEILVVCGSVFLMAEARETLGIDEPRDSKYIAEVAGANLRHGQEFFGNNDPEKEK